MPVRDDAPPPPKPRAFPVPRAPAWAQGQAPWGNREISPGDSTTRMSRIGCAFTAVAELGRAVGGSIVTPGELLSRAQGERWIVPGDPRRPERKTLIEWRPCGRCCGIELNIGAGWLHQRQAPDLSALRKGLAVALVGGGGAILHVTEKGPGTAGHHYLSAVALDGQGVLCADPANGAWLYLDPQTLQGPAPGLATYRVVGLMPGRRIAE